MQSLEETLQLENNSYSIGDRIRKINDFYFKPKSFEKDGTIYKKLGIEYLQKLFGRTVVKALRKIGMDEIPGTYFIGKKNLREGLRTFEKGSRFNEAFHGYFLYFDLLPELMENLYSQNFEDITPSNIAGITINSYLIMLQRYNRARIYNRWENKGRD